MNQSSAALAMVTRPTLPDVLPRKRLFDLLEDLRRRPLIWVSGPPGCGKTTLVGSYLDILKIPSLWYNLDERDSDPATFFYYMGLAAQKKTPRTEKSLPLLTPEYLPDISTFPRRYFENLCLRLKSPTIVVFGNYQGVPSEANFHEVLRTGLSVISEGINAIFISRSELPDVFARQKANRMMLAIGWDQLRFTLDETRQLLQLSAGSTARLTYGLAGANRRGAAKAGAGCVLISWNRHSSFFHHFQRFIWGLACRVYSFRIQV